MTLRTLIAAALLAAPASAAPVLMIAIDGLRPQEWQRRDNGLALPALRGLAAAGSSAAVTGVLPTVTYPSHTTLITGAAPRRHGIADNLTFDPLRQNAEGWYWYASDIKADTLWQAASRAGRSVLNVHWPVSVGAAGITANLPQYWRTGMPDDDKLQALLNTPGLPLAEAGPYPTGKDETIAGDEGRTAQAVALIQRLKPDFSTVYLTGLDHEQHEFGPDSPAARAVLERIDAAVGRLVAAARAVDPATTIVIVSDHGFAPTTRTTNLFVPFIKAGLIRLSADGQSIAGWDAIPWTAGGSAAIVLARPDDAALKARVAAVLAQTAADPAAGIDRVLDSAAIATAGGTADAAFWVNCKTGWTMGDALGGGQGEPTATKGMHGYFPDVPAMRASLIASGPGIAAGRDLGVIDMRSIAPAVAARLGAALKDAEKPAAF
ncbi:ectonucleotide pyrophosphatase/phosphodiesterase [Sandarakinorhabdus sp. AAP62]|uniref:alkaline phosphatase family protein n=1 Tax=Sandarakinorhabdus sp. AAP62 TaxID=1248916 RepID=UPI0002D43EE2|nr:ectonucleotide pyrophosphatase/phosphodiesterase [Sandarakinorhabdus sp. AAP62]